MIRFATPSDATRIGEIHVATWRAAYRGIVPDAFLASMSVEEHVARWRGRIEANLVWPEVRGARDEEGWRADDPGTVTTTVGFWFAPVLAFVALVALFATTMFIDPESCKGPWWLSWLLPIGGTRFVAQAFRQVRRTTREAQAFFEKLLRTAEAKKPRAQRTRVIAALARHGTSEFHRGLSFQASYEPWKFQRSIGASSMKRTFIHLFAAVSLAVLFSGCASGPATPPDAVSIVDVHSTPVPDSEYTSYKVKVFYSLRNADSGVVMLGFDLEEPGRYILLGEQKVGRGAGEVEVLADVRLPKRDTVTLYVNLSEERHPDEWTPLADTSRLLTITK